MTYEDKIYLIAAIFIIICIWAWVISVIIRFRRMLK
jgi:hypothetical protein